jgi:hypothetical protein
MRDCCNIRKKTKKCVRKSDKKIFKLPRKFSKKRCLTKKIKGFTMRSSCAPFKDCKKQKGGKKTKKRFLYNPNNPKKSFDVYIDKNPKDTIHVKYTTVEDVKNSILKLERLFKQKKYTHKRIWQVAMIMKVRLDVIKKYKKSRYPKAKNINERVRLITKYYNHLKKRTKLKTFSERSKLKFMTKAKPTPNYLRISLTLS